MAVVATTFETEARSNTVAGLTGGDSGSSVKWPKALRATSCPRWVMATEAPGKACWEIASPRIEKAREKTLSWREQAFRRGDGPTGSLLFRAEKPRTKEFRDCPVYSRVAVRG